MLIKSWWNKLTGAAAFEREMQENRRIESALQERLRVLEEEMKKFTVELQKTDAEIGQLSAECDELSAAFEQLKQRKEP